jgi:hypothetical protein
MNDEILAKFAEALTKQTEILASLQKDREGDLHTKTPASIHTGIKLHGDGGVFATPGLERDVITAHIRPHGLASELPLLPSTSEDPRFASLTGFTDDVGSGATNACDDAQTGYIKGCNLTARFGMVRRDTNTIEMDKVMLKVNRGDFTDLVLRGRVLGLTNLVPSGMNEGQILNVITMAEMISTAVRTERELTRQTWQGSYAIANEFPGLDAQIATGQVDTDTNTLCPALDSDVKNYAGANLSSTIVDYVSQLEWYLRYNAEKMGLDPVNWVIVMRPDLWYELTALWPCAYNTTKCSPNVATNSTVFIDGRENVADRDAMRNGMYLDVNGRRYRVVTDTGIFEQNNANTAGVPAGHYRSSIYFVPLTITGGFPVTYREYVDYRQAQPDISLLRGLEDFFWTDNGVFSWAVEQIKWCYKLALKTEQRVILRTPQLAGRVDNIQYAPMQHLRDSDPDSPYWFDGGVSVRGGLISTPNAIWA